VLKLFELNQDIPSFKTTLRDFLVQINVSVSSPNAHGGMDCLNNSTRLSLQEFASEDNRDLYAEEAEAELVRKKKETLQKAMQIPGMVRPMDRPDEMMD